ncbi:MAG: hypothetical protein VKL60_13130 [Sphaerospermopsis sp.]|nr:hypothetical protein [Sphaerospermopsis sp.]
MADNLEQFNSELDNINKKISDLGDILGDTLVKNLAKAVVETRNLSKNINDTKSITAKLNQVMEDNEVLIVQQAAAQKNYTKALQSGNQKEIERAKIKRDQLTATLNINQQLEDQLRLLEGISKTNATISTTVSDSYKKYLSIGALFKVIIDSALRFNKISVNIGKNLGYGADNANRVTTNLKNIAQSSANVNVTLQNAAEAMNEISTATGYVAEYSADALQTQIMLTKQFGLTGEEAAGIYKFSVLTGKASSTINKEMVGAFAATRNNLRAGVPFKATMAEAAKVSGVLASNLQNNPKRIVEAVVQAKALGTSLEQSAKQGEALLNFESSLENELKAELLTGKQLNLERARAAALAGDQVALTQELAKNVGTIEEFDRMNVLQKKAIAEAVGLTADELANQLRNQKLAIESGKSLAQVTEEELLKSQQRQDAQEKFNQAIIKLQDIVGNLVAGPLGMMLEMFADILSNTVSLGAILGGVVAVNLMKTINTLRQAKKLSYATAVTEIISSAFKSMGGLPVIGLALAGAAAGAGIAYLASQVSKADDIISPGYGQRAIVSPEGTIALNNRDTIVAGTDLGGGGGGMDLSPMIAAINEVRAAINNLMNRPVIVNMDSKQVGSSLVQASPKSA